MRAAIYQEYGGPDVVTVAEVAGVAPGPGQLLIRVQAAALNPLDWKLVRGDLRLFRGWQWPKFVGTDFAGLVESVGTGVAGWQPGEAVFGSLVQPLAGTRGALGDYVVVDPAEVVRRPPEISAAAAAALPIAGASALECLRLGGVAREARVLVVGAAGGVGSYLTGWASGRGARVTGVCRAANADYVRGLGADAIVAYDREGLHGVADSFDAIIDTVGIHPFSHWASRLTPRGVYVLTVPGPAHYLAMARARLCGEKQAKALMIQVTPAHLAELATLAPAAARVARTHFTLGEAQAALTHSRSGHARGKFVIDLAAGLAGS